MKSILAITAFVLLSFSANAQSSFDKFFEKYKNQPGYTCVNISKELFQMFSNMGNASDTATREMKQVMGQLDGMKVLSCSPDSLKPGMANAFYNEAVGLFSDAVYKELMTVNDGGSDVRFLTRQNSKGKITEMVMMAKEKDEIVVLNLTGLIDLATISKLSKSMNIHGMENLQKMKQGHRK